MKIRTQTIPPALAVAWKKLFAQKPVNAAGVIIARTTKRTHMPAPSRATRKELADYEQAVDFLIDYLTKKDGHPPAAGFRAAQIANLKSGTFDPLYWAQCTVDSEQVFSNAPTSAAWVGLRNYAYPNPLNLPSKPTYGAGMPAVGALDYTGATIAGTFKDLSLKWRRVVFSLANTFTHTEKEPLFLKLTGSVAATANVRASRAMLSAIIKRWIVLPGSAKLTTTESPVLKPIQAFWRYRTPRGGSPYYAYTNTLRLVYSMRSLAKINKLAGGGYRYEETPGTLTKCVVCVAPMPMMGKRFNNNTSVASTLTATLELWQIKKGAPGFYWGTQIIHADGSTETVANILANWYVFFDGAHGIMENTNPVSGLREYWLLDGKLNKTAYAAPWQALPGWNVSGAVMNWYPSATGFLIAVQDSVSGLSNFYYLNANGTIASQGDGVTNPAMWSIIWTNQPYVCFLPSQNVYLFDVWPYTGVQAITAYSPAGAVIWTYDYSLDGIWNQGMIFASDTQGYVITSTVTLGIRTVNLWKMTVQPIVLVATFTIGASQYPGIAYHAGLFYIFGSDNAAPLHTVSEAGVVASFTAPRIVSMLAALPTNIPWVTNA